MVSAGEVHLPGRQIIEGGRSAFVRHMQQLHSGLLRQHLARQVQHVADPGRCVADLPGLPPGQCDQVRQAAHRQGRRHRNHHGPGAGHQGHRGKVALAVVRQPGVKAGVDGVGCADPQQGVPVCASRYGLRGNDAVGPCARLHHHWAAQGLAQLVGQQACHQVRAAPGCERQDDAQRPCGPGGSPRARRERQGTHHQGSSVQHAVHGFNSHR